MTLCLVYCSQQKRELQPRMIYKKNHTQYCKLRYDTNLTYQSIKDNSSRDRRQKLRLDNSPTIVFPIAGSETDHQATGRIECCVNKTEASDYTHFTGYFSGSPHTRAIKTRQLQAPASSFLFLRLQKAEPSRRQGGHVGFSE